MSAVPRVTAWESFNPTLVRLRHICLAKTLQPGRLFQSHAGSIEAHDSGSVRSAHYQRFNPTLVRLRLLDLQGHPNGPSWFQSHAGSIEAFGFIGSGLDQISFNPTLVRLRPWRAGGYNIACPGFNPTLVRLRRELVWA